MNKPYDKDAAAQATSIRIYSSCTVPVKAGGTQVTVVLDQAAGSHIAAETSPPIYLKVEGPHDRLQPTDVVGCYPAEGSDTSPEEFLPHIALGRRSLPWERDGVTHNGVATPWLALLVLRESEILTVGGDKVHTLPLSALKAQDPDSYAALRGPYTDDTRLDLIRVTKPVLGQILPRKEEVALLCHVQQLVGPPAPAGEGDAGDPMWALDADCQVAVVVANRLPDAGTGAAPPEKHLACLVSIEGREDLPWPGQSRPAYTYPSAAPVHAEGPALPVVEAATRLAADHSVTEAAATRLAADPGGIRAVVDGGGGGPPPPISYASLVVLRRWSFTPGTGGDFEQVAQLVGYSPNGGVLRFGVLPRHLSAHGGLDVLTADGKLDLAHAQGGQVSFQGPLTPAYPPARSPGIALRAQAAPPTRGHEPDDSYAAAFELGRLLALGDEGLLSDLQDVRLQLVLPKIAPDYAVDKTPVSLQKRLWGVDPPDWDSMAALPDMAADPGGVESIVSQIDQIAGGLNPGGTVSLPGGGGIIDIGNVAVDVLDGVYAQVVAAQRR